MSLFVLDSDSLLKHQDASSTGCQTFVLFARLLFFSLLQLPAVVLLLKWSAWTESQFSNKHLNRGVVIAA